MAQTILPPNGAAAVATNSMFTELYTANEQLAKSNWAKLKGRVWSAAYNRVATDYQVVGAGSTIAKSTAFVKNGTSSLAVTLNRGAADVTDLNVLHAVTPIIDNTGRIGFWVYVTDYTLLSGFVTKVSHGDATFTNGAFQSYNMVDGDKSYNGWHFVALDKAEFAGVFGTPNWALPIAAIRITFNQVGATATTVYLDSIVTTWRAKAKLIISNDDGWATWFTNAVPILDTLKLKSTASIIAAQVDLNSSWVTSAQLASYYANGHDLAVHGGLQMSSIANDAARRADIAANKTYLDSRGYTRGSGVYVWPNGQYQLTVGDQSLINILKDLGFVCARGTTNPRYTRHTEGLGDSRWLMPIIGVDNVTTPAAVMALIDTAVTRGITCVLMYHEMLLTGAASGTQRNISDFQQEMEYVKLLVDQGKLDVVTYGEWAQQVVL